MAPRRGTIWSNVRWIHPERTERGTGRQGLKEKLRYFTFRDDRNVKAPSGGRRWVDHGLGSNPREILENCENLSSDDRLAWTVMLSPKPKLMLLIEDEADRKQLLENLTEQVVEEWFEARGYVDPQYAFVMHDRATSEEGHQQLHTHIIFPGTVETSAGRERFDHRPTDLRQFNELVEDLFEQHMDRQLGLEWRVQWAAIQREEALAKHLKSLELENLPPNMAQLADLLHSHGLTPQQIPSGLKTATEIETWANSLEPNDDLDQWLGWEG